MTAAAFSATYSDWKVIKGRKVVQIVFELPLEKSDEAYQVLGGMPIAATEKWCAIARLNETKGGDETARDHARTPETQPPTVTPFRPGADKRPFRELTPSQQAGILCNEAAFWTFLQQEHPRVWRLCAKNARGADDAAAVVRELCRVNSRADIKHDSAEWASLVLAYRIWQRHPELSSA